MDRKTSVGAAVHPGAFAHAIPSTVIQETSEVWYQFINSEVSAKPVRLSSAEFRELADENTLVMKPGTLDQWTPMKDVLSGRASLQSQASTGAESSQSAADISDAATDSEPLGHSSALPTNVRHGIAVRHDPTTGGLRGLPEGWAALLPDGCTPEAVQNAALPPELRPTAQPKRGEKLHDEVVIGTPFNVHQWRPQFGLPPEACETLSVNGFDIPILLVRLWDALKRHGGLEEEGIFRLAPDAAKCAALREALNTDGDALERVGAEQDTHVLANLIKIWFRMLPTKLLAGVTAEQIRACDTGAQCMAVLLTLSPLRQGIFLWLLEMMSDVAEHGAENRMSERAVAIVVAPNLYDPPPMTPGDDAMAAVTYTQGMARFVTELLTHYVAVRGKVRREQGRDRHVSIRSAAGLRPPPPAGAAANDSQPSDASSSTTAPPADSCATSAFC